MPTDMPQWTDKDPTDEADYSLDFNHLLPAGDSISSVNWVAQPGGLNIVSSSVTSRAALATLADGVPGGLYRLTATITSTAGRVLQRSVTLLVRDL